MPPPPDRTARRRRPARTARALLLLAVGLLAGCVGPEPSSWEVEASTTALTIRTERTVVHAGTALARVQSGRVVDGCPAHAQACASAAGMAPPYGETVRARAGGPEGPVASGDHRPLPAAAERLLTLDVAPATAEARDGLATARPGPVELGLTPARGLVEGLPLRGTLDALSRRFADTDGPFARLETLTDLLDAAGTTAVGTVDVAGARAEATSAGPTPRAFASGGDVQVTIAPQIPGTEEGLVILTLSAGRAGAGVAGTEPTTQVEAPVVRARWLNLVSGEYEERVVDPEEGGCVGPAPLRACVEQDPLTEVAGETTAHATVGSTRVTLFSGPLPSVVLETGPVEASVDLTPATDAGGWPLAIQLAAVLALVATVLVAGRQSPAAGEPAPE